MTEKTTNHQPLLGDCLVIFVGIMTVIFLFKMLWKNEAASQLQIRQGDQIIGSYDLNQTRELHIHGPLGDAKISIKNGKVRFKQSPCRNQYCVRQGWLRRQGQIAICLPNQISVQLTGSKKIYDSLNY